MLLYDSDKYDQELTLTDISRRINSQFVVWGNVNIQIHKLARHVKHTKHTSLCLLYHGRYVWCLFKLIEIESNEVECYLIRIFVFPLNNTNGYACKY